MKKKVKIITILLSAFLFCSCSDNGSDIAADIDTSISSASAETASDTDAEFTETRETETSAADSPAPKALDFYSALSLDGKDGLIITGEPLTPDKLEKFQYWLVDLEKDYTSLHDFLKILNIPEITDLCIRAQSLARMFSNEYMWVIDELLKDDRSHKNETVLDASAVGKSEFFVESGRDFDSFAEAYLAVFTKSALDRIFSWYPCFASYNGELWFVSAAMTGDITVVHREYELITNTESEILFREIEYCIEVGEPFVYDQDKKEEYNTYTLDYKFVMTENGWRVDEFPIYSGTLDGYYPGFM